jgi:hypothetical protein
VPDRLLHPSHLTYWRAISGDGAATARECRRVNGRRQAAAGLLLESIGVLLHSIEMSQRVPDGLLDRTEDRVTRCRQSVVHPESFFAGVDQSRPPQVGEMSRRFGLRNSQALVDMTDADLAGEQEAQNPQPGRVRERLEDTFHFRQRLAHICALTNILYLIYSLHTLTRI